MRNGLLVVMVLLAGCGRSGGDAADLAASKEGTATATVAAGASGEVAQAARTNAAVEALLASADELIAAKKWQEAIDVLNRIVQQEPRCAPAYFKRAGILGDLREDALAAEDFSRAIQLEPTNAQYHNMRGFFLLTRKAHRRAVQDFSRAIELDAGYKQPRNNRGLALVSLGQYEAAIADFDQAIGLDDGYVDAYNNRGFAYFTQGKYVEAAADFERALELDGDYINAYNNHGLLCMKTQAYDRAVADFTNAITRDPQNSKYYVHRREAYLALDRKDEAEQDAEKVVWLSEVRRLNNAVAGRPANPENHIRLAQALVRGGKAEVAQAHFAKAIDAAPDEGRSYLSRAAYWFDRGEYQKAIADCDAALEREATPDAYSLRGESYLRLEDYDNAIADFDRAQRIDVRVAEAYYKRAKRLESRGQGEAARRDYAHAFRLDPALQAGHNVDEAAGEPAEPERP